MKLIIPMLFVFSGLVKDDTEMGCVGKVQYTMTSQVLQPILTDWLYIYTMQRTQDSYLCGYGQTKREVHVRPTWARVCNYKLLTVHLHCRMTSLGWFSTVWYIEQTPIHMSQTKKCAIFTTDWLYPSQSSDCVMWQYSLQTMSLSPVCVCIWTTSFVRRRLICTTTTNSTV